MAAIYYYTHYVLVHIYDIIQKKKKKKKKNWC